jgi:hypothetical protein
MKRSLSDLAMQQQLLLLCRLLLLVACFSSARAQPAAADVSNSRHLLDALQSNAEVIVLQNALGEEFVQFQGAPLPIQRCSFKEHPCRFKGVAVVPMHGQWLFFDFTYGSFCQLDHE